MPSFYIAGFERFRGAIGAPPAPATYQGPGDVVGSAFAWWGLRAYTLASIGSNAVDIQFSGDSATVTYVTVAGGGLNLTQIAADLVTHGGTMVMTKLYDQTGGGLHFIPGAGPVFNLNGFGSLPSADPTANDMFTASFTPPTLPLTLVTVAKHATSAASMVLTGGGGGGIAIIFRDTADNQVALYNGGAVSAPHVTATDGQYNSIIGNFASPSSGSFITVGGVDSGTGDPGSSSGSAGVQALFSDAAAGSKFVGGFQELGIWAGAFSGTQRTNMYNNHHTYYGV